MNANKRIALTFDDGPHPVNTPLLLDVLKEYHAKASFFVVAKELKKYPEIAKRMVKEGHELGNHTRSHPDLAESSKEEIYAELRRAGCTIEKMAGYKPTLFRPPYLSHNKLVRSVSRRLGYVMVLRTIETHDYSEPGVDHIIQAVMHKAGDGEIVLFHDGGGDRLQTVRAVEVILRKLARRGYQFVIVSKLLEQKKR